MRGVLLLALLGGCSSSSSSPTFDLRAGCMVTMTGDVSLMDTCSGALCQPPAYDSYALNVPNGHAVFDVDGGFMLRSYASADLRGFDVLLASGGKNYAAEHVKAGMPPIGSVTITPTFVDARDATVCSHVMHGSATAMLVEYDTSNGMIAGSGTVAMAATF